MFAVIKNDLIIGKTTQPQPHNLKVSVGDNLHMLRFDGTSIVALADLEISDFYIDGQGVKHIVQHDDSWQFLQCKFDDELVMFEDSWRIKTAVDEYQEIYSQTDLNREEAYTSRVRPYLEEANIKQYQGDEAEYSRLMDLAVAERAAIQNEYPWPEKQF